MKISFRQSEPDSDAFEKFVACAEKYSRYPDMWVHIINTRCDDWTYYFNFTKINDSVIDIHYIESDKLELGVETPRFAKFLITRNFEFDIDNLKNRNFGVYVVAEPLEVYTTEEILEMLTLHSPE
jgi:hypothetical protein